MIIDTHHHFWNYNPVEFDWIDNDMNSIRQSFLPKDLKKTIADSNVSGVISIQARQIEEETKWLLSLAQQNDFVKGIIGWLPLTTDSIQQKLEQYSKNKWLKGLRHVIQEEKNPEYILQKSFNRGISLLNKYNLIYEILIFENQLPYTIRFVDMHPEQTFVLDHIAKPKIRQNEIESWANNIKELAKRDNVTCKISGMVTEANYKLWTPEQLHPYFDVVLEAFGPSKLMFGSDWPVCLVATQYKEWIKLFIKEISIFSQEDQEKILYKNAFEIYHFQ